MGAAVLQQVAPEVAAYESSPHSPVILTGNPVAKQVLNGHSNPAHHLPVNGAAFDCSSSLFEGQFCVHIRGLPTTQPHIFHGKQRTMVVGMQGKFKRAINVDDWMVGQEWFFDAAKNTLSNALVRTGLSTVSRIMCPKNVVQVQPGYICMLTPALASAQIVHVTPPGQQPPSILEAVEDARALHPKLQQKDGLPVSAAKRKKMFATSGVTAGMQIDTSHTFTLLFWGHHMQWDKLAIDLPAMGLVDVRRWIAAQMPLHIMGKDVKSGEYVVACLVWHQRMLPRRQQVKLDSEGEHEQQQLKQQA